MHTTTDDQLVSSLQLETLCTVQSPLVAPFLHLPSLFKSLIDRWVPSSLFKSLTMRWEPLCIYLPYLNPSLTGGSHLPYLNPSPWGGSHQTGANWHVGTTWTLASACNLHVISVTFEWVRHRWPNWSVKWFCKIRDVPLMTVIQPIVMHHQLGFGPSWMTTFCDDLLEGHNKTVMYKGIYCSEMLWVWTRRTLCSWVWGTTTTTLAQAC